ncbi:phenylalanine--tRNA ligase subunit beta [Methylobacter sp. S3L5C]|uniref:phenylalanine--tRNA ligase subunit beta n=1 Tax=Methylobacter sp. S3L5C TaxID=2839024 RepID=UPI001FAB481E|nr:phenylalanine--tRNA ligase subunit beta [Methylobacter sp. S3L5C]UOA07261.1 phenylalanine--tRNA ligase subunit beta [Methylobacter sp. S3L5C]
MQISEAWLRSYVNPAISTEELVEQLTMAGLEVGSVEPAAAIFSGVVVGEVMSMHQHPDADRLRICHVAVGQAEPLQIVCGASNVRVGLKIPAALIGAILPGDFKIKRSKLRGEESFGMLCSEKELGLATDANGLMELADDAPVGVDIRDYLSLDDNIIEVDLTPNRADCLCVEGLAREVAVLNKMDWTTTQIDSVTIGCQDVLSVSVEATEACPRYLGRLINSVNAKAVTPHWMQERLRRSGLRSLGPLVDVTNYVLIELGQPLHVFDTAKLSGGITVRLAKADEALTLLNNQVIKLDNEALVIADDKQVLALAGIMGGSDSAVNNDTRSVFLECAFFAPHAIAGKARRFGLHTDSSHRFERGVDATLQLRAIERATQLIIDITGGEPGPITEVTTDVALPQRQAVLLRRERIAKTLGIALADEHVVDIFQRLAMVVQTQTDGWQISPPGFRFDIAIEADLIEEVARIYGYNNLPSSSLLMRSELSSVTEALLEIDRVKDLLVDRGYQEAITYSFVDEDIQKAIAPEMDVIRLQNPISSELAVMRTTLWCGLLKAALYNTNRQQNRVRLFEAGLRFIKKDGETQQQKMLAGLVLGDVYSDQWGDKARKVDFFDMKADIEAIFTLTGCQVKFSSAQQPALHPGQTAEILTSDCETVGWMGMLHPNLEKQLGFDTQVFLFELDQNRLLNKRIPVFKSLSKYPSVKRDLALIVNEDVSASEIVNCIMASAEPALQEVVIFDIYRGKGVEEGSKSIALTLVMQDYKQTLTDPEIDAIVGRLLTLLNTEKNARLRD